VGFLGLQMWKQDWLGNPSLALAAQDTSWNEFFLYPEDLAGIGAAQS
jgi:hypothetical protein